MDDDLLVEALRKGIPLEDLVHQKLQRILLEDKWRYIWEEASDYQLALFLTLSEREVVEERSEEEQVAVSLAEVEFGRRFEEIIQCVRPSEMSTGSLSLFSIIRAIGRWFTT